MTGAYKVGAEELDEVDRSLDRNDVVEELDDGKLDDESAAKSVLKPEKDAKE